ncbi:MAG TPA: amino acid permease [Blastocatellia bacterium]|nr:amino acid permease [Blastocatellia bacterium]HNG33112.1 amino acid permease [Blastocatellia bacterium]
MAEADIQNLTGRLRRDLGTLESYAALIGILIGAGIFTVTSQAWRLTGPSVILGYVALFPVILATSVPYAAFLSTPLGREPGGEYTHLSRTLGDYRLAFVGAWLKIISYVGAEAFLANSLADYLIAAAAGRLSPERHRLPLALAGLLFFYLVHAVGIRWFGRLQVAMCSLLGVSLVVLIVPGLFAVQPANYQPFIAHGLGGFLASLAPLFFSYAGFESLAQTAGEVKDSTRRLPMVFLKGISLTALIFVLMSAVAFGVLPGARLGVSSAPMAEVAAVYLPAGAAWFVTFGAIMALTTSMNSTMLVPSRLALLLARDGMAPGWIGVIHPRTGTPIRGLTLTLAGAALLLLANQIALALNIAVFALVILYFLHSLTFLLLPRRNPSLFASITINIPASLQRAAVWTSLPAMGGLIALQVWQDVQTLFRLSLRQRLADHALTSLELVLVWGAVGVALYAMGSRRGQRAATEKQIVFDQPLP